MAYIFGGVKLQQAEYVVKLQAELDRHKLVTKYFSEQGNDSEKQIVKNILGGSL